MAIGNCLVVFTITLLSLASSPVLATDGKPLQDYCVADKSGAVPMNGFACKPPESVKADDFTFRGLNKPGDTNNTAGFKATLVTVNQIPGLNTQGVSMVRLDFAPGGVNAPHIHPRASELLIVMEGTLEVGFVTTLPETKLITKVLQAGEAFVFPQALTHYQRNVGKEAAVGIAALDSQNPGTQPVVAAVLGSCPKIPVEVVAKALQADDSVATQLQSKFK
ncbi:unnamed protein product [Linum tenue]|uniref:Germin-like protein n=1 Tax=Linum tenue TaxID=586396 RepID=A0AAV0QMT3_9ROSI|nr:unnamed protein product [Linum tenue]CAI0545776.1 unnamed protein product [Linum tenue]